MNPPRRSLSRFNVLAMSDRINSKRIVLTDAQKSVVRVFLLLAKADMGQDNAQEEQKASGNAGADDCSEAAGLRGDRRKSGR